MRGISQKLYGKIAIAVLLVGLMLAQVQAMAAIFQERANLMEYLMNERPVLANLIIKAGLTPVLSDNTSYTILAPSEEDLQALKDLPPVRLRAVLAGHIIKGQYREVDFKDGANIETLAQTKVNVCRKKDHTLLDGVRLDSKGTQVGNSMVHGLSGKLNI